jgi:hypothetical protein
MQPETQKKWMPAYWQMPDFQVCHHVITRAIWSSHVQICKYFIARPCCPSSHASHHAQVFKYIIA